MGTDLTGQLRDYLDQVAPVTVEEILGGSFATVVPPKRRSPHLAAVAAIAVLALGGLSAVLFGQGPRGNEGWCPDAEFPAEMWGTWADWDTCEGPLIGRWELISIVVDGRQTPIPSFEGRVPSFEGREGTFTGLVFRSNGSWSARACNTMSGFYRMSPDSIEAIVGISTLAGCHGEKKVIESTFYDLLHQTTPRYKVTGDQLEIRLGQTILRLSHLEPRLDDWDLACGSLDGTNTGEAYHVSATIAVDSEGRLLGADREGGRSPETAFNGIAKGDLAAMVRMSESRSSVVFATLDGSGKVTAAVKVQRYGEQWIATEGVFCDLAGIWRSEQDEDS